MEKSLPKVEKEEIVVCDNLFVRSFEVVQTKIGVTSLFVDSAAWANICACATFGT